MDIFIKKDLINHRQSSSTTHPSSHNIITEPIPEEPLNNITHDDLETLLNRSLRLFEFINILSSEEIGILIDFYEEKTGLKWDNKFVYFKDLIS